MILDKPLTQVERRNYIDMLEGCKNRICVTDDVGELFILLGSAVYQLNILAQSRYLELKEREVDESIS